MFFIFFEKLKQVIRSFVTDYFLIFQVKTVHISLFDPYYLQFCTNLTENLAKCRRRLPAGLPHGEISIFELVWALHIFNIEKMQFFITLYATLEARCREDERFLKSLSANSKNTSPLFAYNLTDHCT